jgi:shikimate dehydrogenase
MSKYIGLIGYPLKHSLSPYFQQAALDYYGLDILYQAWETIPADLADIVENLRRPQNLGANVTVPYKEIVLPLLDEVHSLAGSIGAVNTIVKKGDKLVGYNTDSEGFIEALEKDGQFDPEGKSVVMIGAGGVARAVGFALLRRRVASLSITDRRFDRASALTENLVRGVKPGVPNTRDCEANIGSFEWQKLKSAKTFENCDLIAQCTIMGMKDSPQEGQSPLRLEVIPRDVLVYDVVYNPGLTPLLGLAQKAGASTLGGLPMLAYQGAASFKLWIGKEPPVDIMFKRAKELLAGKQ